jgi:ferritin
MINEKMNEAFNNQIKEEMYSANLYLSMTAYFEELGLKGFANWMKIQVQEETAHAMGIFDYIIERGGKVTIQALNQPKSTWNSPLDCFDAVYKHEQLVTSFINKLIDVAEAEKDRAALSFLQWYIKEQVEEEANCIEIIAKLKLIGADPNALLLLDKDLSGRTFTAPAIG